MAVGQEHPLPPAALVGSLPRGVGIPAAPGGRHHWTRKRGTGRIADPPGRGHLSRCPRTAGIPVAMYLATGTSPMATRGRYRFRRALPPAGGDPEIGAGARILSARRAHSFTMSHRLRRPSSRTPPPSGALATCTWPRRTGRRHVSSRRPNACCGSSLGSLRLGATSTGRGEPPPGGLPSGPEFVPRPPPPRRAWTADRPNLPDGWRCWATWTGTPPRESRRDCTPPYRNATPFASHAIRALRTPSCKPCSYGLPCGTSILGRPGDHLTGSHGLLVRRRIRRRWRWR